MGTTGHVNDVMPDFHGVTLRNQIISYITRKPIPTSLPWSTVISTLFLWMCLGWKGVGEERRQEGEGIIYKEKRQRLPPPLALCAFFFFVFRILWICMPRQSLFIKCYHNLWTFHISFFCKNQISFIRVFPFH